MAHFAKINQKRIVTQVIVADEAYIETLPGTWIQTSYTAEYRKNYAGIGYTYDYLKDAFIPPQIYSSWVLNEDTCQWEAPVAYPDSSCPLCYYWDETIINWVETIST
jgi:hypothetical protein